MAVCSTRVLRKHRALCNHSVFCPVLSFLGCQEHCGPERGDVAGRAVLRPEQLAKGSTACGGGGGGGWQGERVIDGGQDKGPQHGQPWAGVMYVL